MISNKIDIICNDSNIMDYLREYKKRAIESSNQHKKCLINMWC